MSSSGFVPSPSSKRDLNEYCPWKTPSPTVSSPEPPCRSPRHSALPLRVAMPPPPYRGLGDGGSHAARPHRLRPLGRRRLVTGPAARLAPHRRLPRAPAGQARGGGQPPPPPPP